MTFADPLELFRVAAECMRREDYLGAAQCCDPVSLRSFRRQALRSLTPPDTAWYTVDMIRQQSPDMPVEVAEYQVQQMRRHAEPDHNLRLMFPSVSSRASLEALAPDLLFAAHLDGRSPRRQLAHQREAAPATHADADRGIATRALHLRMRAIGAVGLESAVAQIVYVYEGDEVAPVKHESPYAEAHRRYMSELPEDEQRLSAESASSAGALLANCRRQEDGGWLMLADWTFIGLNASWGTAYGAPDDGKRDDT